MCKFFAHVISESPTVFMKNNFSSGDDAQTSTIHWWRHYLTVNHFKAVHHTVASKMILLSVLSMKEKRIFLTFIDSETWPTEMQPLRENTLQTNQMDAKLIENHGNYKDFVGSLEDAYKRHSAASLNKIFCEQRTTVKIRETRSSFYNENSAMSNCDCECIGNGT